MINPRVSVGLPVYNGAKYLAECIESVLNQTYTNYEYLIVNNCSTDKTLEIAEEYASKNKHIQVHSNDKLLEMLTKSPDFINALFLYLCVIVTNSSIASCAAGLRPTVLFSKKRKWCLPTKTG